MGQDLFFLGCFPFDTFCDCLEMLQSEFIRISLKIALVAQCLLFTRSVKKVAYVPLMFICVCASHRACPCCVCMIIIVLRTSLIYSHKWAVYSSHFCSLTRPPWVLGAQIIFCWRLFLFCFLSLSVVRDDSTLGGVCDTHFLLVSVAATG